MTIGAWGLLAVGVGLAVMGFGFRLGYFCALGWAYFDPEWRKNRFYRNGMFALAPGSFMFLAGRSEIRPHPGHPRSGR
jgi:hypothetical protein